MDLERFVSSQVVDLSNCEREAIHIPGSIQPHGVLFVLQEPELIILQVSNNTQHFLGIPALSLINQNLSTIFPEHQINILKRCLQESNPEIFNPLIFSLKTPPLTVGANNEDKSAIFDGIVHRYQGVLILELEPIAATNREEDLNLDFYPLVKASILKIQQAATFKEAIQLVVQEIRRVTGYDRVMIYRFEPDESGVIIAEEKLPKLESYLNLHYPASDIPKQARKLYYENWLRLIVDVNYEPVEIIPSHNPLTNSPLDLSYSLLRSVSPLHREYAQNMGFRASICISLINEQQLWGLIVGHHYSPKYVDYSIRRYCEFIGRLMSVFLVKKQEEAAENYRKQIRQINQEIHNQILSNSLKINEKLQENRHTILNLINATGAVICLGDELTLIGQTPPKRFIRQLLNWLHTNSYPEVFATNHLSQIYPPSQEFKDSASGLLAISIFLNQISYHILWFRPELIQTINWGGNPFKPVEVDSDLNTQISPRKSFQLWQETVREKSLPWQKVEIDAAQELRNTLMLALLEFKQSALATALEKAEVATRAKSQFLAKMSHELRTPLNAILGFTQVMLWEDSLSNEQRENMQIIHRSSEHLLGLINDVLEVSKIEAGRLTLNEHSFDLYVVLHDIKDMLILKAINKNLQLIVEINPEVPQYVIADESKLRQVLINLLDNAIKFTSKGYVKLRVSMVNLAVNSQKQSIHFLVEDTGKGIANHELDTLFDPFVQTETGREAMQGTGLGLTISRQFVRMMKGDISVSSTVGVGSVFSFMIPVILATKTDIKNPSDSQRVISLEQNQSPYRILVVEDVEENRLLLLKLLEKVGFTVRSAVNGVEAIHIWEEWEPHLIFMDMLMPVLDGYQATKQIKATLKGQATVIIALTAYAFSEQHTIVLEAGCDDFIAKPLRDDIIFDKIARYLGVRYIYAEKKPALSSIYPQQTLQLTPDELRVMPQQLIIEIYNAALEINEDKLLDLINQIPPEHADLKTILQKLVDEFRWDIIAHASQPSSED
ncbi:MAG: ATP-binding protein [Nostocaceae cyanobacterium]|nr:ATP-binding protein [Nostocaceae cyanobacterium]